MDLGTDGEIGTSSTTLRGTYDQQNTNQSTVAKILDQSGSFSCGTDQRDVRCGVATVTALEPNINHDVLLIFRRGMWELFVDGLLVQNHVYGGIYPLPPPPQVPTKKAEPQANSTYLPGIDLPGGDYYYHGVNYTDPHLCEAECIADSMCKAWTYVAKSSADTLEDYPVPRCCLKNLIPISKQVSDSCTSGVVSRQYPNAYGRVGVSCRGSGDVIASLTNISIGPLTTP